HAWFSLCTVRCRRYPITRWDSEVFMTPSLEVSGLAFAYPDGHQALFGVDFRVSRGERVALLGPNGAGKTTLVLHLNGILTGGAGSVTVGGLAGREGHLAGGRGAER